MHKTNTIAIGIRNINTKSGLGKIVLEQVNHFLAQNIQVDIYTSKHDKLITQTDANIIKVPRIPLIGEYFQRLLFSKFTTKLIKKKDYDLVIGHGDLLEQDVMFLHNLVERAYFETHKKQMQPLNAIAKIRRLILKQQNFKLLIANSELMKDELTTTFNIPADKIKVIYPGYDPKQFNTDNHLQIRKVVRTELGLDEETLLIGFITSGDFKKRALDLFIEALHTLPGDITYKVLLVGKDKNLPFYINLAKQYNLDKKFIIREPIEAVERYFHAVDFTVHPAHFEEFGMVVQEAMACGIPVITSKYVGASEIMLEKSILIESPNLNDLSFQIQRLLENPELRKRLSEKSLQSVTNTDWNHYVKTFSTYADKLMRS